MWSDVIDPIQNVITTHNSFLTKEYTFSSIIYISNSLTFIVFLLYIPVIHQYNMMSFSPGKLPYGDCREHFCQEEEYQRTFPGAGRARFCKRASGNVEIRAPGQLLTRAQASCGFCSRI